LCEAGNVDIADQCRVAEIESIGIGDDVFNSCGSGGGNEVGVDVGRGADGEGYDENVMALESFCKIVDVGIVDFGDGDRVGKRRVAGGTGEGGDGVVAKGEELGEDVVAYVSCSLS